MGSLPPMGWSLARLGDHIDILSGFPFKSAEFTADPENIGLIRIRDLLDQNIETFYSGDYSDEYVVSQGDILIGMDGDFHIVQWKSKSALLNQRICKLVAIDGGFDIEFVYQFLIPQLQKIHSQTGATTVKHLSVKDIRDVEAVFAPLPEQKKIASILTSVDEVIESTQKKIDKLQDLKKATMNELLTKGIGHTEFKDSELGRIPKGWEVRKFGETVASVKSGLSRRLSLQDIGVPVVNSGNISASGLDTRELKYWYLEDPQGATVENYFLEDGDILLNFINSAAQIGKACLFNSIGRKCIYTTNIFRIRVATEMSSAFLLHVMKNDYFKDAIQLITKPAVNQASFTKEDLLEIPIQVPSAEEQDKIVRVLDSIESAIEKNRNKLRQTESLKRAVMQDLLTGKVRVSVD